MSLEEKDIVLPDNRNLKRFTTTESDVTQLTVWKKPCESLNQELDRTMSLLDYSGRDLLSAMQGVLKDVPIGEVRSVERVQTAALCAREIVALARAKIDAVKLYKELNEENSIKHEEEDEGDIQQPAAAQA